jgi:hypothetical protein
MRAALPVDMGGRSAADERWAWLVAAALLSACGARAGVEVTGAVTWRDGRPVEAGEVWLEPDGPTVVHLRPVRVQVRGGRFHVGRAAGVQAGTWVVRVSPPPPFSIAAEDDAASVFATASRRVPFAEPSHGPAVVDFVVEPWRRPDER